MKNIITIITLLIITSCSSSTKSTWSCPTLDGGKGSCISIKDADLMPSFDNQLMQLDSSDAAQNAQINLIAPKLKDLKKLDLENTSCMLNPKKQPAKQNLLRTEEKIGRVWFASYIDSEGSRHSEKIIYVVDEEAKWTSVR